MFDVLLICEFFCCELWYIFKLVYVNVVCFYEVGEMSSGGWFIVMEYVECGFVKWLVGNYDFECIVSVIYDIC